MKNTLAILMVLVLLLSISACVDTSISNKKYNEISNYVLDNLDTLASDKEIEFFSFESTGLSIGSVYYGYYYTIGNEILLPDFYKGNDIDKIKNQKSDADGGTYFGKPNNGTDWCYIKEITENWYYYELHWA